MVRFCAVPNCSSNKSKILSHRFPRNKKNAKKWQTALHLETFPLNVLCDKFVICGLHFNKCDYRNTVSNHLNAMALPKVKPTDPRNFKEMESSIATGESFDNLNTLNECDKKKPKLTSTAERNSNSSNSSEQKFVNNLTDKNICNEHEYQRYTIELAEDNDKIATTQQRTTNAITLNTNIKLTTDRLDKDQYSEVEFIFLDEAENKCFTDFDDTEDEKTRQLWNYTKDELIQLLIDANRNIGCLEEKLKKYQNAHLAIGKHLEMFKT